MRKYFILLFFTLITGVTFAQETYSHQTSSVPSDSRYEIVQSERGARYTFKIDKFTGEVYELVKKDDDKLGWQSVILIDLSKSEDQKDNKVNYQVFISGLGARYIFLININNGQTLQLTEDTDSGASYWMPIF